MVIALAFVVWAAAFIFRTSFVAIDHHRYFSLFDDAMISMRYAWNFSHGAGLVWNAGERIQGYTNLLMTLIMSVATFAFDRSTAVIAIQILGVGLMLSIGLVTMAITDHLTLELEGPRRIAMRAATFFCVLGYYPLVYWSLLGMETGLLAFLVGAGVLAACNFERTDDTKHVVTSSLCFGFAVLTRMDGVIFAAVTWLYLAWTAARRRRSRPFMNLALFMAVVGLFFAGQMVFQYAYYGELLPNTYTLKLTGMPLADRVRNGLGFTFPFLKESVLILALAVAGLWLNRRPRAALLLAQLGAAVSYEIYVGGDPWNYWRMTAPCMPLAFVLVVCAIDRVTVLSGVTKRAEAGGRLKRLKPVLTYAVLFSTSTVLVLLSASVRFLPEIGLLSKPMQTANAAENINTALVLERVTTRQATIAVVFAGSIPYYIDRRAIDLLGKSDRYIARLPPDVSGSVSWFGMRSVPGHNKYDLDYSIKRLTPTYVQIMQWGRDDLTSWAGAHYVNVEQSGVKLWLLRDSPDVLWSRVSAQH